MAYKKFLQVFFSLLCPLIIINIISAAIFIYNPKLFYYRPWEYFSEVAYMSSQYEASWDSDETSDLTRKTFFYYQDPHRTHVSTDKYGFRSNFHTLPSYPILVSGDSTIFGSGLSDNETLPWKIAEKTNIPVFNGGRSYLFNTLLRPELSRAKLVIDCITERNISGDVFSKDGFIDGQGFQPLTMEDNDAFELLRKVPSQRYLATSIAARNATRMMRDTFVYLFKSEDEYRFINHKFNENDLENAVHAIVSRKKAVNTKGIEYMFIAIPAKQTIYGNNVDDFTKNYIHTLTDRLRKEGVKTVDLVDIFKTNKPLHIYHNYDTHWNAQGVEVAASVIADLLTHPDISKAPASR